MLKRSDAIQGKELDKTEHAHLDTHVHLDTASCHHHIPKLDARLTPGVHQHGDISAWPWRPEPRSGLPSSRLSPKLDFLSVTPPCQCPESHSASGPGHVTIILPTNPQPSSRSGPRLVCKDGHTGFLRCGLDFSRAGLIQ